MFRTNTSAQIPWLGTQEMLWQWVEMVSNLPHFLVTVHQPESTEDLEFHTTLLFSDIQAVLSIAEKQKNKFEIVRIDLLSPDYLNGSSGPKLSPLLEVWLDKQTGGKRFVLADGACMEMQGSGSQADSVSYEKVLSLPAKEAAETQD